MGLGPPELELYRQLKISGAMEGVADVMELGSQDFWCPQKNLVKALFKAFGREVPDPAFLNTTNQSQLPASKLYDALGIKYHCVDVDGRVGSVTMDLNFDSVPKEHVGKYAFVTNHGTSEHILNQYNVFKTMHDFAKVGGLFIHDVPFTVHLEHGFFNYQPNFFEALARYNSYETLGVWVGPDWQLASLIPWDPILLDFLTMSSKTTHRLVVVHRKMFDKEFCVPFQEIYENMVPDEVRSRYSMIIDGEIMDSKRVKYLTKDEILAKEYKTEIMGLNNWIASYKGQIEGLKHDLAVLTHHYDQLRYGPPPHPFDEQIAKLGVEIQQLRNANDALQGKDEQIAKLIAETQQLRNANDALQGKDEQIAKLSAETQQLHDANEEQIIKLGAEIQQLLVANEDLQGKTVDRTTARVLAGTLTGRIKRRVARMFHPS